MKGNKKEFAVYTCLTGDYEKNPVKKHILEDDIKYICFSDNEASVPDGWEFRSIDNLNHLTNKDKNRYIKLHPHEFLKDFNVSIYIDSNIQVINKLSDFFFYIKEHPDSIFMYEHPFRKCTYKEIEIVVKQGLASFFKAKKQCQRYRDSSFPSNFGLFEANIIIRKHDKNTYKLMKYWWSEYQNSSKRDQTSLPFSSYQTDVKIHSLGPCNLRNGGEYFYLDFSRSVRRLDIIVKNFAIRFYNNTLFLIGLSLK